MLKQLRLAEPLVVSWRPYFDETENKSFSSPACVSIWRPLNKPESAEPAGQQPRQGAWGCALPWLYEVSVTLPAAWKALSAHGVYSVVSRAWRGPGGRCARADGQEFALVMVG